MKIIERAIDAIVFCIMIVLAIEGETPFVRIVSLVAAGLLLLSWFVAWRRGRWP